MKLMAKSALPRDEWPPELDRAELNEELNFEKVTTDVIEAARSKRLAIVDIIALKRAGPGV